MNYYISRTAFRELLPALACIIVALMLADCGPPLHTLADVESMRSQNDVHTLVYDVLGSGRHPAGTRIAAAVALAKIGAPAVPDLLAYYETVNPEHFATWTADKQRRLNLGRCLAAYALGEIGPAGESAVETLLNRPYPCEIDMYFFDEPERSAYAAFFEKEVRYSASQSYKETSLYSSSIAGIAQPSEGYTRNISSIKYMVGADAIVKIVGEREALALFEDAGLTEVVSILRAPHVSPASATTSAPNGNVTVSEDELEALAKKGDVPGLIHFLERCLPEDRDAMAKAMVLPSAMTVGKRKWKNEIHANMEFLISCLSDRSTSIRNLSLCMLTGIAGPGDSQLVEPLVSLLREKNAVPDSLHHVVNKKLKLVDSHDEEYLFVLYPFDMSKAQRYEISEDEIIVEDYSAYLNKLMAARMLGDIGDGRAVVELIEQLKPFQEPLSFMAVPEYNLRCQSAWALGKIGDGRAVEPLITLLEEGDLGVRASAAYALGLIGPEAEAAVPALVEAFPVITDQRRSGLSHHRFERVLASHRTDSEMEDSEIGMDQEAHGHVITERFHVGADALEKITGQRLGNGQMDWAAWWNSRGGRGLRLNTQDALGERTTQRDLDENARPLHEPNIYRVLTRDE